MSTLSTATDSESRLSKFIPVDIDKAPIKYLDNPAHLNGCLHEFFLWSKREGHFIPLFENRIKVMHYGKSAIDHPSCIPFVQGTVADAQTYSFTNPCPPGQERLANHNTALALAGKAELKPHAITSDDYHSFQISSYTVQSELTDLANALISIVTDTDVAQEWLAEAADDGIKLLAVMRKFALTASSKDRTVLIGTVDNMMRSGVLGEVTFDSFNTHIKEFNCKNRYLAVVDRKSDESIIQMVHAIMYKDKAVRDAFEMMLLIPGNKDLALTPLLFMVRSFLRSRNVSEELDAVNSGVKPILLADGSQIGHQKALASLHAAVTSKDMATVGRLLAGGNVSPSQVSKALAAVTKLALEPTKDAFVKPPRDASGRITKSGSLAWHRATAAKITFGATTTRRTTEAPTRGCCRSARSKATETRRPPRRHRPAHRGRPRRRRRQRSPRSRSRSR